MNIGVLKVHVADGVENSLYQTSDAYWVKNGTPYAVRTKDLDAGEVVGPILFCKTLAEAEVEYNNRLPRF